MKSFFSLIKKSADEFNQWLNTNDYFRVYGHLDADGISSSAIIIKLLKSLGKQFHLSIIEQLTEEFISELSDEGPPLILLDFGSGQLEQLSDLIKKRLVLILDHHQPQGKIEGDNLIHVNPCLVGVDGGLSVSASGVTYLFSREFKKSSFNASLAIIGAQGDLQDMNSEINSMIINDSSLEERQDLDVYGLNTRPIHKALEYSDLIPELKGDETACVSFLSDLGIQLKSNDDWRTINDLSSDEKQRLISAIIVKTGSESVFKTIHEFSVGKKRSTNEWSAVLNACGRMNMPSMGVCALMNPSYESKVDVVLKEYRKTIAEGLRWVEDNKDNDELVKRFDKALFFNAGEAINHRIIGTICSIKSMNEGVDFIIGLAHNKEGVKVSVRRVNSDLNANELVSEAVKGLGVGGGHAQAAGATIRIGSESEFISKFNKLLK